MNRYSKLLTIVTFIVPSIVVVKRLSIHVRGRMLLAEHRATFSESIKIEDEALRIIIDQMSAISADPSAMNRLLYKMYRRLMEQAILHQYEIEMSSHPDSDSLAKQWYRVNIPFLAERLSFHRNAWMLAGHSTVELDRYGTE